MVFDRGKMAGRPQEGLFSHTSGWVGEAPQVLINSNVDLPLADRCTVPGDAKGLRQRSVYRTRSYTCFTHIAVMLVVGYGMGVDSFGRREGENGAWIDDAVSHIQINGIPSSATVSRSSQTSTRIGALCGECFTQVAVKLMNGCGMSFDGLVRRESEYESPQAGARHGIGVDGLVQREGEYEFPQASTGIGTLCYECFTHIAVSVREGSKCCPMQGYFITLLGCGMSVDSLVRQAGVVMSGSMMRCPLQKLMGKLRLRQRGHNRLRRAQESAHFTNTSQQWHSVQSLGVGRFRSTALRSWW